MEPRDWRALVPLTPALRLERLILRFGGWWTALDTVVEAGGARDLDLLLRSREGNPTLLLAPSTHAREAGAARRRVDPRMVDWSDLGHASKNGHLALVERLLQEPGVDARDCDSYAIRMASSSGQLVVVERLLQVPGVNAAARGNAASLL